jgi:dihydrofolate synthase/folylpolyglutamate synthase
VATAITSIGFDHTELLGDTLAAIAAEKAGIAKPGVPLLLGALPAEALAEVERVAALAGAPVRRLGLEIGPAPAAPALAGRHQAANAALAVALAEAAARALGRVLPAAAARAGLAAVHWPGRLERVGDVLFDCAHNPEGAAALRAALPALRPRALVVSIVRGKRAAEMLATLAPAFDHVVATRSRNERSLPPEELAALAPAAGPAIQVAPDPAAALAAARAAVGPGGLVVVAGSIFVVGELRASLLGEAVDPVAGGDPLP